MKSQELLAVSQHSLPKLGELTGFVVRISIVGFDLECDLEPGLLFGFCRVRHGFGCSFVQKY